MRVIITIVLLLLFSQIFGQTSGVIRGRVTDSSTNQPLALGTVSVFHSRDSSLLTYRLTDEKGQFRVPGLPLNTDLRLLITYSGFSVYRKEFRLTADVPMDAGVITLSADSRQLQDVLVYIEQPPVIVKKDTIEFNASAFKTLPTALVEDLLKKLPGVEVTPGGDITVNGKRVTRILVDGKDFFNGDPRMATRNLPANIIDKIQVTDDKDELELNPDIAKANVGQVLNLKLRKAIKKGWFGKVQAGAGTSGTYDAGGIVNLFKDTLQVSVLGFGNNLNRAAFGFEDLRSLGGFNRSNIAAFQLGDERGFTRGDISFGGNTEGVQRTGGAGFNTNTVMKNNLLLNVQYFYGATNTFINELAEREQFYSGTILTRRTNREEQQKMSGHRFGFGLRWSNKKGLRVDLRPKIVAQHLTSERLMNSSNVSGSTDTLNFSNNFRDYNNKEKVYAHTLSLFKTFTNKRRSFNMTHSMNDVDTEDRQVNTVSNIFLKTVPADTTSFDQLRNRPQEGISQTLAFNFNEPIARQWLLRVGNTISHTAYRETVSTFSKSPGSNDYAVPEAALSNSIGQRTLKNNISVGLNWSSDKLSITGTVNYMYLRMRVTSLKQQQAMVYTNNYALPGIAVNYGPLNISYNIAVSPPMLYDIQPVPDNTDAVVIFQGNPGLVPAKTHNLNLAYGKYSPQKLLFVGFFVTGRIRENAVVRSRSINIEGIETVFPVNQDGNNDFFNNFHFNKQYKLSKLLKISAGSGYNLNYSRNYLLVNGEQGFATTTTIGPLVNFTLNWNDIIEFSFNHTRSFNRTKYKRIDFPGLKINYHSTSSDMVFRGIKRIVLEASLSYRHISGTIAGISSDVSLLNSGITYLFGKSRSLQLKISGFDLLNNNVISSKTSIENYLLSRQVNSLKRYFMFSLIYDLRNINKSKVGRVGGIEKFFNF